MLLLHALAIFVYILALEQCIFAVEFIGAVALKTNGEWTLYFKTTAEAVRGEETPILFSKEHSDFFIQWESRSYPLDVSELRDEKVAEMKKEVPKWEIESKQGKKVNTWSPKKILLKVGQMMKIVPKSKNPEPTWKTEPIKLSHRSEDLCSYIFNDQSKQSALHDMKTRATDFTGATIVKRKLNSESANSEERFLLEFKINGASEKSIILHCKKKNAFYINWKSNSLPIDTSQLKKEFVAEMMEKVTKCKSPEYTWNAERIKLSHISDDQKSDNQKSDNHQTSASHPEEVGLCSYLFADQSEQSDDISASKAHATDFTGATIVKRKLNSESANSEERFLLEFEINGASEKSIILYCKKKNAFYINWKSNSLPIDTSQLKKEFVAEMMEKVTKCKSPEYTWNAERIKLSHISDDQKPDHHTISDNHQTSVSHPEVGLCSYIFKDQSEPSASHDTSALKTRATDFTGATIVKRKLTSEERFILEFKINGVSEKSIILHCKKKNAFYINWKSNSLPIDTSRLKKEFVAEMMEKVTKCKSPEYTWNAERIKLSIS